MWAEQKEKNAVTTKFFESVAKYVWNASAWLEKKPENHLGDSLW
jgi:hypothetical protein